jgi:hypothetical protein
MRSAFTTTHINNTNTKEVCNLSFLFVIMVFYLCNNLELVCMVYLKHFHNFLIHALLRFRLFQMLKPCSKCQVGLNLTSVIFNTSYLCYKL